MSIWRSQITKEIQLAGSDLNFGVRQLLQALIIKIAELETKIRRLEDS